MLSPHHPDRRPLRVSLVNDDETLRHGLTQMRWPHRHPRASTTLDRPGKAQGLTHREGEMVTLITQGRSNQLIDEQTFLSINSVKSYIRTAYRTMGFTSRSQAVPWGAQHGLGPAATLVRPRANVLPLPLVPRARHVGSPVALPRDRETS